MEIVRYNHLNTYLNNMFGTRVLKICVDGKFTCPNRDGTLSFGGCDFCSEKGSGELINKGRGEIDFDRSLEKSTANFEKIKNCKNLPDDNQNTCEYIRCQVLSHLKSYRGKRAEKFIVYFQNFTNTFDTCSALSARYDCALGVSEKIVGIEVATRPDCITEDIAKMLARYKQKYYVCVELGFQTVSDDIKRELNILHTTAQFVSACKILSRYDIPVVAHIMVGLPNSTSGDLLETVKVINSLHLHGVKIHCTYVLKGTKLACLYKCGKYAPPTMEQYVESVGQILSTLNPDIVIHRITADPPKESLLAPEWTADKKPVLNAINRFLEEKNIFQGDGKCSLN